MKECLNWRKTNQDFLECFVCAHFCKIKQGRVGICGVRQNQDNKLYSWIYGRAAAINIDPIEKKPLFHFLPGSFAYSFGTFGCNFRCDNCQNFDLSQINGSKGQTEKYPAISWGRELSPEQIVKEALKNQCQSIAYTYNEPTVFLEYALETMKLARKQGLKNVWVSNGFMSEQTLDLIIPFLDAINIDIKSFEEKFYQNNCGAKLKPILENCQRLAKEKIWLEITTLIIPSLSDDEKILRQIAQFIKEQLGDFVPWHLSAFSGAISWKLKHLSETSLETIEKACAIGKAEGLKYVYAGNVWSANRESTFCPNCGKIVIKRIGYQIERQDKQGKCRHCGEKIQGVF